MRTATDYVLNRKAVQHYLIDHDLTQGDFAKVVPGAWYGNRSKPSARGYANGV